MISNRRSRQEAVSPQGAKYGIVTSAQNALSAEQFEIKAQRRIALENFEVVSFEKKYHQEALNQAACQWTIVF